MKNLYCDKRTYRSQLLPSVTFKSWVVLLVTVCVTSTANLFPLRAQTGSPTDGTAIMKKVYQRPTPNKLYARLQMTVVDGMGARKERTLKSWVLKTRDATKSILLFESPADVRNAGFLSVDRNDPNKADDQWLYLPSLRRASRIANSERSGAFMGSDFSYSDLSRLGFDEYSYKLIDDAAKVGDEACWVVEVIPQTDTAKKKTGYERTHQWISKEKLLPLQMKAWIKDSKKIKYLRFASIEKVDGRWVPRKLLARTLRGDKILSTTVLEYLSLELNPVTLSENDFTVRRLERGL